MSTRLYRIGKVSLYVVGGLAFFVVMTAVLGYLVQLLWNQTLAAVFELPTISYWQAVGLFVLAKLFFGFGMGGSGSNQKRRKEQPVPAAAGDPPPRDDEVFRAFWQTQGRAAYEEFLARRQDDEEPSGNP